MAFHDTSTNAGDLIEIGRRYGTTGYGRIRKTFELLYTWYVGSGYTRTLLLRLYTSQSERLLKHLTVVSIMLVCALLTFETWDPYTQGRFNSLVVDWVVFGVLLTETFIRTLRLEFLPSFAKEIVSTYGTMSADDVRRFQVLKIVLFRVDLLVLVALFTYLIGVLPIDPLYASMARLLRLVAILRAFDIPLMRDLTAVILSAFESMSLVFIALGMHVFVYSVVGTVLFGGIAPSYFGDLLSTMNTLLYPLVNKGDSPAMKVLCNECGGNSVVQILYFSSFLWIGGVILLGLLTRLAKEKVDLFRRTGTKTT
ncbi:MAG TPA: ion transporter [Candidatus Didemnitutus sp.]|nr:ion transporter [Candidatus Didemnitutus sp.]